MIRGHYGVKLTPSGQRVEPLIRRFLAADEALEREIQLIHGPGRDGARGGLRQHCHALAAGDHPAVSLRVCGRPCGYPDGQRGEVYRWVREGKVDMCCRQEGMNLEWIHLRDDPLLVILPKDEQVPREWQLCHVCL